jgi:hypothetical protein
LQDKSVKDSRSDSSEETCSTSEEDKARQQHTKKNGFHPPPAKG